MDEGIPKHTQNLVFIKAKVGPPNIGDQPSMFTVQYFDEQGNMIIRSGGKRAWRCNHHQKRL